MNLFQSEIPNELEARKIFLQGFSRDEFPLMIVQTNKHFLAKDQIQFKRLVTCKTKMEGLGKCLQERMMSFSRLKSALNVKRNNQRIRTIRNGITGVRKELHDLRNLRNFGYVDNQRVEGEGKEDCVPEEVPVADADCAPEEVPCEAGDEAFGQANEPAADEGAGQANEAAATEGAVDETTAYEGPANLCIANEGAANEAAAYEGPANLCPADEVVADEGGAPVDEECAVEGDEKASVEGPTHEGCEAHQEGAVDADEEASTH
ncbi:uncharacterized protein LOC106771289 [Vigna radiata var. radiata]|uniref:Uncharacterized protein LOC106771289 n=1 Tax=Vigna radiata var. radiata TaxID=3916 RepID=A0A3Q0FDW1_VIGRR|nr:uncharacterized protein LOC106771289 [Vigna radiata var. radiata]